MTIKEIYRQYLEQLQQIYSLNESTVITDWVFESVAAFRRFDIIKKPGQILHPETVTHLNSSLKALLQHKPVQYVLGETWFYKMKLKVNEAVLIPRPETEELVQLVVDRCKAREVKPRSPVNNPEVIQLTQIPLAEQSLSILDIGTGSGCIAIALKKNLPSAILQAIDISPGALSVAKENAHEQGVDIQFLQFDFLDEKNWHVLPLYDIIISNPPYIPSNEKTKLDKNVVDFEPHVALFVPAQTPLLFYEKIASFAKEHIRENGKIYLELHEDLAEVTAKFFEQFYQVEIRKDLFGKDRMLIATYNLIPGNKI